MNPTLVIDNSGRRSDGCYLGFLVLFWIVWTPVTVWATLEAFSDFNLFWVVWLPFGYIGMLGIPFMLWQSRKPQVLESAPDSLQIRGTGLPFARVVTIPRGQKIKLHFGHYGDDGEGESVATLNVFSGSSWWTRRIMIAPLAHPSEKRKIFHEVEAFLTENGFNIELDDDHPKTRSEQDAEVKVQHQSE